MSESEEISEVTPSPSAVGSRARKQVQRAADANPVKDPSSKTPRPTPASAATGLDKVTGEPSVPTPTEGRKGNLPPSNPFERTPDSIVKSEE